MNSQLRKRLKIKLEVLAHCDWLDHNNCEVVLDYIEGNVTALGNIWSNIESNLVEIRNQADKNEKISLSAFYEAQFQLNQMKQKQLGKAGRLETLKTVLELIDQVNN